MIFVISQFLWIRPVQRDQALQKLEEQVTELGELLIKRKTMKIADRTTG